MTSDAYLSAAISPLQCSSARAALGINQSELGRLCQLSTPTIANFERGSDVASHKTLRALDFAFKSHGIQLLEHAATHGIGLRLISEDVRQVDGIRIIWRPPNRPASLRRAARQLVKISQQDLSARCGYGIQAIIRAESDEFYRRASIVGVAIRTALERSGALFIESELGEEIGVCLAAHAAC